MFIKLVRIGRSAELRYTPSGKAVIGLACVYDIGYGQNKKPQWIEVVIWDKQAEALAPYLLKGNQVVITCDDLELETYESNGKTGSKLKARAVNIALTDSKKEEGQQQQAPQQKQQSPQQQRQSQQQQSNSGFDDSFEDDIPF